MEKTAIEIHNLTVSYQEKTVIFDANLAIPQGVFGAIIGPNGAGKTTLIKAILGLIKADSGTIFIFNKQLSKKILTNIAYVPQSSSIDWQLPFTVYDITIMGTYGSLGWFKRPGKKEDLATLNALDAVNMLSLANEPIRTLSGGQRQRVLLARALAQAPLLYVLDEPFNGVDQITEETIVTVLKKLRDSGKTIVAVHHDLATAPHYFEWEALLNHTILAYGAINQVITPSNLHTAYGKPITIESYR